MRISRNLAYMFVNSTANLFKVNAKTNYLRHDPFISFRAFRNLSHCQEQLLAICNNIFNKNIY